MKAHRDLLRRRAFEQVTDALEDTRVVVVNGARQVGKSTLAQTVLTQHPTGAARFLDDTATRQAAADDPTAFVRHDGLLLIDEVQRVPDLWLAIKHEVDRDPRPGRFLLTGSARLLALRALPDALVAVRRPSNSGRCPRARSTTSPMGSLTPSSASGARS